MNAEACWCGNYYFIYILHHMTILYTSSHTTKGVTVPSSLDVRLRKDADRV